MVLTSMKGRAVEPSSTSSPRAEVGEIDTRAPFQSVRAAVSLFGEVKVPREEKPHGIRNRRLSMDVSPFFLLGEAKSSHIFDAQC